jgi:hypothetical protein
LLVKIYSGLIFKKIHFSYVAGRVALMAHCYVNTREGKKKL